MDGNRLVEIHASNGSTAEQFQSHNIHQIGVGEPNFMKTRPSKLEHQIHDFIEQTDSTPKARGQHHMTPLNFNDEERQSSSAMVRHPIIPDHNTENDDGGTFKDYEDHSNNVTPSKKKRQKNL